MYTYFKHNNEARLITNYVESLTGQQGTVQTESQELPPCFDLIGSRQHGVAAKNRAIGLWADCVTRRSFRSYNRTFKIQLFS